MPTATLDVGPNGAVGVVWTSAHEDEEMDVYFAESTNQGVSFGSNYRINPELDGLQRLPEIAYDGTGRAHLFWEATLPSCWDSDIAYAYTDDGGVTISDPVRVNDDPPNEENPQETLAAAGLASEGVLVIWMDMRASYDENIFFARTHDPMAVPEESSESSDSGPALVFDSIALHASSAEIFDITGRCMRTYPGMAHADRAILWDGRNDHGRRVASGRYFIRLQTSTGVCTRPVTLVR